MRFRKKLAQPKLNLVNQDVVKDTVEIKTLREIGTFRIQVIKKNDVNKEVSIYDKSKPYSALVMSRRQAEDLARELQDLLDQ